MHRTSLRTGGLGGTTTVASGFGGGGGSMGGGGGVAMLRPPKPPCWRDFVSPEPSRKDHFPAIPPYTPPELRTIADPTGGGGGGGGSVGGGVTDPTDTYSIGGGRLASQLSILQSGGGGGGGGGSAIGSVSKPSKPTKRVRARIHRTRSEHLIDVEELPEGELTVSLADTRPHELRLRQPPPEEVDERLYEAENNRRCQSWLASIEAAEPLDDIGYNGHSKGPQHGEVGLEAVDVEVPEETFSWSGDGEGEEEEKGEERGEQLKPPFNTSASSSDSGGLLQHVMAAVGYAASGEDSSEGDEGGGEGDISKLTPRGRGSNGRGGRGGLRSTSSTLNVHSKLSSKRILAISEHSGLE
ncbi:uncharacterized protein [Littorina saxatilis]|uniref:uncharacterized protein n=1 Tax=Littorina saxatilis TaxID=31220 RepID=UPI0038B41E44